VTAHHESATTRWHSIVSSALLPVSILGFVIVSYIALRPFPPRVRYLFDFVCFVSATLILLRHEALPLPNSGGTVNAASSMWLHAVAGTWWLLGARVLVSVLSFTLNHNRRWREARLFPDLTAAAIYTAAILVVLISVLALPIGGLLATSGVLAIVLGLALQNTLADVFAGIAFGIEAPVNVGDRISLGDKIEGAVVQMNWRSIRILTDGDDVAIIPNSVVAKSDIVNRSSPRSLSIYRALVSRRLKSGASHRYASTGHNVMPSDTSSAANQRLTDTPRIHEKSIPGELLGLRYGTPFIDQRSAAPMCKAAALLFGSLLSTLA
jgi:small-conductance mechanosensitive channel